MAPRGRQPRKNRIGVGNTRMDAALDSMRQFGFHDQVVRETVDELLEVYDGTQGWPFIEEASYKLLIETILAKQQSPAAEQQEKNLHIVGATMEENPLQDHTAGEVIETSATPTAEITDVGSSTLVAQDSLLQINDSLDSASQTDDRDLASLGNETGAKEDSSVLDGRGGHEQEDIRVESRKNEPNSVANVTGSSSKSTFQPCYGWSGMDDYRSIINEPKPVDNATGSGSAFGNNAKNTFIKPPMIESSKSRHGNRKPSYNDNDKSKKKELKPVDNVIGSWSSAFGNNVNSTFVKPPRIESSKSSMHGNRKPSYSDNDKYEKKEPKPAHNVTGSRSSAFVNNAKSTFAKTPMIESSKSPYHNRKPSYRCSGSGSNDSKSKKNEQKPADNVTRSSRGAFISNVESTFVRNPVVESPKSFKNPHYCHRKPFCGWIDDDDEVELITLPTPLLPEHIEKLVAKKKEAPQSCRERRRKSRWDEMPEGM
ncbi:hypothetical protein TanjilG_29495 [Lupinus angustifolius]|uniref:WIYLD domain-containing protein n=1 Tax=Lupinus angustifolius TaxID=3871 RepID=A0A4P1R624_LUPAN|nr:PREDICTED: uncharacterized protein LOC109359447 [Lupinus angustifolius]OIW02719.1 hypothetical protein TanjilG_29495 [Lupinus angustifolius]